MGINFKVSTCAVARALLAKCSKAHGGISFISDYIESFMSYYNAEKREKRSEAVSPLLPWRNLKFFLLWYASSTFEVEAFLSNKSAT